MNSTQSKVTVSKILEICLIDNPTPVSEKQKLFTQLASTIKTGQTEPVIQNFKKLLKVLVDNLEVSDWNIQVIVLQIFTEIFKNEEMRQCWCNFVELLTIPVINAHSSDKREVVKMAEETAAAMSVFPFDAVVSVLYPLMYTSTCRTIQQGVIKMLTKLIELHPTEVTEDHLASVMPGLINANYHEESSVRKSAVMCMVALHNAVGEDRLAPYITSMGGGKLKLLRLYISRAHQSSLVQTSLKNSANPPNSLS